MSKARLEAIRSTRETLVDIYWAEIIWIKRKTEDFNPHAVFVAALIQLYRLPREMQ